MTKPRESTEADRAKAAKILAETAKTRDEIAAGKEPRRGGVRGTTRQPDHPNE
jgi:hypothetical protein